MKRRDFLKSCGAATLGAVSSGVVHAAKNPPNVLFLICDDLNDWALHPPGHPKALTPNIDRFRKRSLNFDNAHAVVPVCGASRKCLFSGLYPQTIDDYGFARWNKVPALQDKIPMPLHFRNNGYNSYGTGKQLHEGAGGDFYRRYGIDPDYGPWPWRGKGGVYNEPHPNEYDAWIKHMPVQMHRDTNYGPLSDVPVWKSNEEEGWPGAKGWFNVDHSQFRYENARDRDPMPDEVSAQWAIDVLEEDHDKPFYLGVGFVRPHTPLYAPKEFYDRYPLDSIELPPYKEGDLLDCATILRERWQWGYQKFEAVTKAGGEEGWKKWVQAYLACVSFVDAQVGKVLDALEASPHADNTIVVLTSDHGYHIGEKDCIQKWHLWDESTRVPLMIHVPESESQGKTCKHPVSLIDLYPTLSDLCGLPAQALAPTLSLK